MDESSFERLREELMDKYIDTPEELEKQIEGVAEETARNLRFRPDGAWMQFHCPDEEEPRTFKVQYRKVVKDMKVIIFIVIADIHKLETAHERNAQYAPFTMTIESNVNTDETAQLKASLEAFLRHISGAIAPEDITEEE